MPALTGQTPAEAFRAFHEHIQRLLNRTITDSRLRLVHLRNTEYAELSSIGSGGLGATPIKNSSLCLFIGQNLVVIQKARDEWQLRTVRYRYIIQEGPGPDDRQIMRFDYVARDKQAVPKSHPRHHVHISSDLAIGNYTFSLAKVHLPTGWITIEELIRFLITELYVQPKADDWDRILQDSEAKFREWTGRTI